MTKRFGRCCFENPRNGFRTGPAFVAMSRARRAVETRRGRFFGRPATSPSRGWSSTGEPAGDGDRMTTGRLRGVADHAGYPRSHGERTVAVVLGQADNRSQAEAIIRKYRDRRRLARASLAQTRQLVAEPDEYASASRPANPAMDRYLDWLKYQALAERIWARRGFYQASGAFGFRDQLQDSVNLLWMDPLVARRQILLHASQQFLEGDVVHWFHLLAGRPHRVRRPDARFGQSPLARLGRGGIRRGDRRRFAPRRARRLPGGRAALAAAAGRKARHGLRSRIARRGPTPSTATAMQAIDLVLDRRMGAHGLPLIGTGDWNDGLDEIGSQGRGESVWLGFFLLLHPRSGWPHDRPPQEGGRARGISTVRQAEQAPRRPGGAPGAATATLRAIHDDGTRNRRRRQRASGKSTP